MINRAKSGLTQLPFELQSNALPLSYPPSLHIDYIQHIYKYILISKVALTDIHFYTLGKPVLGKWQARYLF